jgi:separase
LLYYFREVHPNSDLFIFCGHGAGDAIPLFSGKTEPDKHVPNAMLWGCSSGKLRCRGYHDPTGPILRHLQAGAYFAVGNLWDVTDKDLDKLCTSCMSTAFNTDHNNSELLTIPEALASAREICKMKFAVGAAAVIFGLPAKCYSN